MADKPLSLYVKGMTAREIVGMFKEMHDTYFGNTIFRVMNAVTE